VARSPVLPWLLAGSILASSGFSGCKAEKTEVALTLKVKDDRFRPAYVMMLWRGPSGRDFDQRVPADPKTMLPDRGELLSTVLIDVDDAERAQRTVIIKGMTAGDIPVSGAWAHVDFRPGARSELVLFLEEWVDTNMNGMPDSLDCESAGACAPSDGGANNDSGGDASGDASDGGDGATDTRTDAGAPAG
jgi:hypothetical protein